MWFKELQEEFSLPKKLIPSNTPDKSNFYDPLYLRLFREINVPVNRNGKAEERIGTILALKEILDKGGRVLIFPEGGRTFKAIRKGRLKSTYGGQLGELKEGAAWLALNTGARIIPIWVDGTDRVLPNNKFHIPRLWQKVTIKIGSPFKVQGDTRRKAILEITQALLELADEKRRQEIA